MGSLVGAGVGSGVGESVGSFVGAGVGGAVVGSGVGGLVGSFVGAGVGCDESHRYKSDMDGYMFRWRYLSQKMRMGLFSHKEQEWDYEKDSPLQLARESQVLAEHYRKPRQRQGRPHHRSCHWSRELESRCNEIPPSRS